MFVVVTVDAKTEVDVESVVVVVKEDSQKEIEFDEEGDEEIDWWADWPTITGASDKAREADEEYNDEEDWADPQALISVFKVSGKSFEEQILLLLTLLFKSTSSLNNDSSASCPTTSPEAPKLLSESSEFKDFVSLSISFARQNQ